jgi:hypothetical protein
MKVITAVVNNPVFIEMQYFTLKKHMQCEYEFIVFNDAKEFPDYSNGGDVQIKGMIENMCKELNIKCVNIPNTHHLRQTDAAIRCADSMNFILQFQKENPDKYLLIDSDMFLVDNFDLSEYDGYECAVVLQSRNNYQTHYFWNGIYYFDFKKMKNIDLLNWSCAPGLDVGGMMQKWLALQTKHIPDINEIRHSDKTFHQDGIYYIKHFRSCSWDESEIPINLKENKKLAEFLFSDPRNENNKFYCEIYDNKFLHYRAGGNWEQRGMNLHFYLSYKLKDALLSL